jgi:hypothetical protein
LLGTVAYAYNPSNSGGRSGEEQFEVSQLSWKNHHKKGVGEVFQGLSLEFKPQYRNKKKKLSFHSSLKKNYSGHSLYIFLSTMTENKNKVEEMENMDFYSAHHFFSTPWSQSSKSNRWIRSKAQSKRLPTYQ